MKLTIIKMILFILAIIVASAILITKLPPLTDKEKEDLLPYIMLMG